MNNSVSELYGHLDELRKRLTVIAVANIGAMMLLFSQASRVIDYFLKINPGMQLVYLSLIHICLTRKCCYIFTLSACHHSYSTRGDNFRLQWFLFWQRVTDIPDGINRTISVKGVIINCRTKYLSLIHI